MQGLKSIATFKHSYLQSIGTILLLLLALLLLWHGISNSNQAIPAMVAQVYFDGEYRISDGPWHEIVKGEHISSTKGDVILRGNFHTMTPDGEYIGVYKGELPIALYTDHIGLTVFEGENEPYVLDMENPSFGDSACGKSWTAYSLSGTSEEPIEILIHNPHNFGNETAIDELLANTAIWTGLEFEKSVLSRGELQNNIGLFFVIVSLVIIGIALFSSLIHIKSSRLLWLLGLVIMFAGVYFTYSASDISLRSGASASNTIILGSAMMLYMFFMSKAIVCFLVACKKTGIITVAFLGAADALFFVVPIITDLHFYDAWLYWAIVQAVVNLVLVVCLLKEYFCKKKQK